MCILLCTYHKIYDERQILIHLLSIMTMTAGLQFCAFSQREKTPSDSRLLTFEKPKFATEIIHKKHTSTYSHFGLLALTKCN